MLLQTERNSSAVQFVSFKLFFYVLQAQWLSVYEFAFPSVHDYDHFVIKTPAVSILF